MVERGDADQRRDASAVGRSQFVQLGDQGGAEDGANAGHRTQQLVDRVEVVIGLDELADLAVQVVDLLVDGLEHGIDGLQRRLAAGA